MGTITTVAGYISASDAFALLRAGLTVYVVSAPPTSRALPLEGAWVDDDGTIHLDCSAVVLNPETAHAIGRAHRQQCIMRISPDGRGNSQVYLFKDTDFTRQVCLKYCGGYTADGSHLFSAVSRDKSVFEDGYCEWLYADVEYIPVK